METFEEYSFKEFCDKKRDNQGHSWSFEALVSLM